MHGSGAGAWCVAWSRAGLGVGVILAASVAAAPPPPDDDPDRPTPGLLGRFLPRGSNEPAAVRVVTDLAAHWGAGSPDARVPADGFRAHYTGMLLIQAPGTHRFFARSDGSVRLTLAGRVVLEGSGGSVQSTPSDLPAGFAPLVLEYQQGARRGAAHLAIDWEGPAFAREPLPARLLYHEPDAGASSDRFEDGRRQADRLGCANCHALLDLPRHPHLGPPLSDAGRAIAPDWLDAWLTDPARVRPRSRMPAFGHGLKPADVADLTAFLASIAPRPKETIAEVKMALNVASPEKGRLLFRSIGCLGCHTRGDVSGMPEERFAPDLGDLGSKRTAAWLAEYLHHPKKGTLSAHRADLRLSADDAAHLAAYLVTEPPAAAAPPVRTAPRGSRERGKELATRLRCAACHEIAGLEPPRADLRLAAGSPATAGCLADAPADTSVVPRYALTDDQRHSLRDLVARLPRDPAPSSPETLAADTVRRRNCLGCHIRDGQGGFAVGPQLAAYLAHDADLGALKGTLTPPDLSAVGDKLRPEFLSLAVAGAAPSARPWLAVRMPALSFEPGEAQAVVAFLQGRDRMETRTEAATRPGRPDPATFETAVALLGQRGFGCVNCHVLAGKIPPGGEPETLGPDLALVQRRMTERYFDRWIGNPQRIIPGTPMPQFLHPVATAPGTLVAQLSTLWELLGSTRVAEAAAQGTREILKRQGDRAMVVRDMVLLPGAPDTEYTPRGLAIGLKNDHSLLFDTDRLTWLSSWHHGFLSRTKSGRLWEWHPEGDRLWVAPRRLPPVVFVDDHAKVVLPREVRGRFGHFAELDFRGSDVALTYALNPPQALGDAPIDVAETIRPTADGWERALRVVTSPFPTALHPALVIQPADLTSDRQTSTFSWTVGTDRLTLRVLDARPAPAILDDDPAARFFFLDAGGTARVQLSVHPRP